jgi:hypothetical protein
MAKNEAKIKFTAETGEFNNQIKKSNDEMSLLRAEMKLNETQMKATGTTVEGLENKHKILSNQLKASEDKTEALNQKVQKAVEIFGENSAEATKLKTQLLNAQNAEEKIRQEVDRCNKELDEQKKSSDKLEKSLDEVDESAREAGEGFTVMKGAMSNLIADGVTGLVNGVKGAISGIAGLEEETREYRAEMGKLDTAFTTNKHSTETAEAAYRELYGIIGETDQSVEAAQQISLLANSEEDVAKWAGYAAGVVGRFGDALQPETFYESANETLKLGEATGAYTQMLEGCGVNVEDFNKKLAACKTEGDKQAFMLETTEKLLGSASESYKETNADIIAANQANADYTETMAAFGEKVAPVTTSVKEGFNGLLQEVYALVEDVDIGGFTSAIESGFATVKDTVLPAVVEGFKNLKEAWQWLGEHTGLLATVATAIGVITTAITAYNVVQGIKTAMDAANVTTVWALVSAHLAQAAAAIAAVAPYILIVAAIAAVIAIIVLCVKHWDTIKAKITEVAKKVKDKVIEMKNSVVQKLSEAKNKAVELFENIKKSVSDKITALRTKVSEIFNSIRDKIMTPINNAKAKAVSTIESLRSSFSSKIESIRSKVSTVFSSIKDKIVKPIETAKTKVKSVIDSIKGFFSGMKLSLPKIKLPHFKVTGKLSLNPPSVPKLSISWYKNGGIMTRPTIFGVNGSSLMGGGEAGAEAILPIEKLKDYIADTVEDKMNVVNLGALADAIERLADRDINLNINGRNFATATASDSDNVNGLRTSFKGRGLAL